MSCIELNRTKGYSSFQHVRDGSVPKPMSKHSVRDRSHLVVDLVHDPLESVPIYWITCPARRYREPER